MKINIQHLRVVSGIYQIQNLINKKIYIGSSLNIYQRAYTYKCLAKQNNIHNKHLQNAINKYGMENFEITTLEEVTFSDNSNKQEKSKLLEQVEQLYIDNLKPEYNIREVADRNINIGASEETRRKISESLKKAFLSGKKKRNRIYVHNIKVNVFDLNGNFISTFPGLKHCADFIGVSSASVSLSIKSKRKRVKNYIVIKVGDIVNINDIINLPRMTHHKTVKILNIQTNEELVFNSCKSCANFIGCKVDTIISNFRKDKIIKNKYKILSYE